jgi:hypothetical protein
LSKAEEVNQPNNKKQMLQVLLIVQWLQLKSKVPDNLHNKTEHLQK